MKKNEVQSVLTDLNEIRNRFTKDEKERNKSIEQMEEWINMNMVYLKSCKDLSKLEKNDNNEEEPKNENENIDSSVNRTTENIRERIESTSNIQIKHEDVPRYFKSYMDTFSDTSFLISDQVLSMVQHLNSNQQKYNIPNNHIINTNDIKKNEISSLEEMKEVMKSSKETISKHYSQLKEKAKDDINKMKQWVTKEFEDCKIYINNELNNESKYMTEELDNTISKFKQRSKSMLLELSTILKIIDQYHCFDNF